MRKILPPHSKISDDAKETIQECVSEYISFITGEANERCQREQRKTITAEDVLWAMSKLGFDDYIEPLTLYLHRYRETEGDRATTIRASVDVVPGFMKRQPPAVDYGGAHALGAFAPNTTSSFHVAHHHNGGFFGYFKDAGSSTAGGSSQAAVANGDQHGRYK